MNNIKMSEDLARVSVPYDIRTREQGERIMAEYIWIDHSTRASTPDPRPGF